MTILEPCASCKHADPSGTGYYCAARGYHLLDDTVLYPRICTFYDKKE